LERGVGALGVLYRLSLKICLVPLFSGVFGIEIPGEENWGEAG